MLSELLADLDACDSQKDAKPVANGEVPLGQCGSLVRTSARLLHWFLSRKLQSEQKTLVTVCILFRQEDAHQEQDQTDDGCFPGEIYTSTYRLLPPEWQILTFCSRRQRLVHTRRKSVFC